MAVDEPKGKTEELAKVKELADKVKSGETKVVDQLTDATAYDTYLEMTAK